MAYITTGYWLLAAFGAVMVAITCLFQRRITRSSFLVARRSVHWLPGGMSIAASWLWAPALFVSVQMAYEEGLAGIFWFTFPNIVALLLFAFLGPQIRKRMPEGITLPQYLGMRFGKRVHTVYLFPTFFYQLMAVAVQLLAGGSLIALVTGIPLVVIMPILAAIALLYTLLSGLEASILTDFFQMLLLLCIGAIILPLTWKAAGEHAIITGLAGIHGSLDIFDPGIAFNLGIVTSIGLLAGALSDQQYWQRAFALRKGHVRKAFVFGAFLFGVVPVALSTLGFIAASQDVVLPQGVDTALIGVQTVAMLLPGWATTLLVLMLLAGLTSTLDSGLSATSSLWMSDVVRKWNINSARFSMIGIAVLGLLVAYGAALLPGFGLQHLWWIFNTVAACVAVPTLLSLYWNKLDERGVFWGIVVSFIIGVPFFIYGNILGNTLWTVGSSVGILLTSTLFCILYRKF